MNEFYNRSVILSKKKKKKKKKKILRPLNFTPPIVTLSNQ